MCDSFHYISLAFSKNKGSIYLDLSLRQLGSLMNKHYREVGNRIAAVRKLLIKSQFVKKHIGVSHLTRDEIINKHTSPFAAEFYGEKGTRAIVVLDGWYLRNEIKSETSRISCVIYFSSDIQM